MPEKTELISEQVGAYLAPRIRSIINAASPPLWAGLEEIRLRAERPLAVHGRWGDFFLNEKGAAVPPGEAYCPSGEDLERSLQLISCSSLYAFEQELRCGYITIPGGHRVGLCGQAVLEEGRVVRLKHITGLNYRLAREVVGCARPYLPLFLDYRQGRVRHGLIVSPPRGGKTTFLRDLTRWLSDGVPGLGFKGFKVAVVDERSEIGGSFLGRPQLNVGYNTDVLDACPKAEGMMMLLRSMAPQVIVTDEIGHEKDISAIEEIIHAGVTVIATAHGGSQEELLRRPGLRRLFQQQVFERVVFLGRSRGVGTVERIIDPRSGRVLRQPVPAEGRVLTWGS
ncbi:MAG: stage III sporulation protein AA [Dethiobacteria bacterium]|nr:stage III sporulation protein AA [Bacillota bacterium]HPT33918.1 stage III sporulation protein AA [Bacillota bacterium]HQD06136.1 stage III sporulation protein AA [Bacillota bacterium]